MEVQRFVFYLEINKGLWKKSKVLKGLNYGQALLLGGFFPSILRCLNWRQKSRVCRQSIPAEKCYE